MDLEEIARENAILKTVLNHTDEAVHIIDCDGITRFYNKVASEMEGMDPEEVLGRHILEVYPSLTLETSSLLKVLQTGKPVLNQQQTLINRKGRAVTMTYSTYPIFSSRLACRFSSRKPAGYLPRHSRRRRTICRPVEKWDRWNRSWLPHGPCG